MGKKFILHQTNYSIWQTNWTKYLLIFKSVFRQEQIVFHQLCFQLIGELLQRTKGIKQILYFLLLLIFFHPTHFVTLLVQNS